MALDEMKQAIGTVFKPGEWLTVEQSRINDFADSTLDHQYIHVNEAMAKDSWLGGTVAHGLLVLSLLPKLRETGVPQEHDHDVEMAINYGFNKVRFLNTVRPGDEVRMCASIAEIKEKEPGQLLQTLAITVEIKGQEKPALACEWLNLFFVKT